MMEGRKEGGKGAGQAASRMSQGKGFWAYTDIKSTFLFIRKSHHF